MPDLSTLDPMAIAARLAYPEAEVWQWVCDRDECDGMPHDSWTQRHARTKQRPPTGEWFVWLIIAGRGFGKTRTGAEWLAKQVRDRPGFHWAIAARSTQDCREVCMEGESGLLRRLGLEIESQQYNRTTGEIRLPGNTVIHSYGAEQPDRFRGPNLAGAWCDELATWKYMAAVWHEGLMPALRVGNPRVLVTTTPRAVPLIKELVARDDGSVIVTRGSTYENAANLSENALRELRRRYEGTRIGRQELYGEVIEDIEGALWTRTIVDDYRVAWAEDGGA